MNPENTKTNSALEHLDIITADIQSLIDNQQDFIGFIIISLGIEFMGSFYDSLDFTEFGNLAKDLSKDLPNFLKTNGIKTILNGYIKI